MDTRMLEKIGETVEYWPEYSYKNFLDFLNSLEQAGCRKTCPLRLVCCNSCLAEQAQKFSLNVFQTLNLATAVNFYFLFGEYLDPRKIFDEIYEYFFLDGGNPLAAYFNEEIQRIDSFVRLFGFRQENFENNLTNALTEFFNGFVNDCLESTCEKRGSVIFQGLKGDGNL